LKWNFSIIDAQGDEKEIKQALHNHLNGSIESFMKQYPDLLTDKITLNPQDGIYSLQSLLAVIQTIPYKIY